MAISKTSSNDDEVTAEHWMLTNGYVTNPPPTKDPFSVRRVMRMCYATGLTHGRADGLKHPHFTDKDIYTVIDAVDAQQGERGLDGGVKWLREDARAILKAVFPEATFDE